MKRIVEKTYFHPRNEHGNGYDYDTLTIDYPELKKYVSTNAFKNKTIDFSKPEAVKALNNALITSYYKIKNWELPENYLCPSVPVRVDYIHHIADLLSVVNNGKIPIGEGVMGLDVGVGANCIYPILGVVNYGWSFLASDVDTHALKNAERIVESNKILEDLIVLHHQEDSLDIFENVIMSDERFAFTMCNPPYHCTKEEAIKETLRKSRYLKSYKTNDPIINFGDQNNELWCDGGELDFVTKMIDESTKYLLQVLWFTTLVTKKEYLNIFVKTLNKYSVSEIKIIELYHGNKITNILAWTFLSKAQQKEWKF